MHNAYYIYCAKMKLQHIYANFLVVVVIVNIVTSYTGLPLYPPLSPTLPLSHHLSSSLLTCLPFFFAGHSRMLFWPCVCPGSSLQ